MRSRFLISISLSIAILLINGCLDPYSPPASSVNVNYLVVDGSLNSNGITLVRLSRTMPLSGDTIPIMEIGATVQIEGDDGAIYSLTGDNSGNYTLPPTAFDTTRQFRLKITTGNNQKFESDFVPVRQAPVLDTVGYTVTGNDLQFYLSAHDDQNKTRYYLWRYAETWAYQSYCPSDYVFVNGTIIPRPERTELFYCWSTRYSSQILIGSTAKLNEDIVNEFPFHQLEVNGEQFQIKYSILVEQWAVTQDAYEYWEQLKKSTESIGTLFDPQPSQVTSNIHNLTNSEIPVVGYFSAGSVQQKRIFITKNDLPPMQRVTFYSNCQISFLPIAEVPAFKGYNLIFTAEYDRGGNLTGYDTSTPQCIDCRIHGGSNIKPDFWK